MTTQKKNQVVFTKSTNHIYEVCDSFAVMGMHQVRGEPRMTLELCRDVVEIKPGLVAVSENDEPQMLRLNFATITLSITEARRLIDAMKETIQQLDSRYE